MPENIVDAHTKHECTLSDLVWSNKPEVDGGECVSIPVVCRICGKRYEEIYAKNDGLWDPDKREYVFPGIGEYSTRQSEE